MIFVLSLTDLRAPNSAQRNTLDWQVSLFKPSLAVQRAQRLLAGSDQVLVVPLAWDDVMLSEKFTEC